jgi:hypothetical protein
MKLFGTFWYSKSQKNICNKLGSIRHNYMRPLFGGNPRQYSEMCGGIHLHPSGKWKDYRFVGFGFYHHTEDK